MRISPTPYRYYLGWMVVLALCVPVGAVAQNEEVVEIQQLGPHNTTTVRAIGDRGRYVGFDVLADGALVAPVRFTSRAQILCPTVKVTNAGNTSTLTFDGLQAAPECGLQLERSRIVVTLVAQRYPVVSFDLHIAGFSPERWQQTLGKQPFHFLTLGMPDAAVWHHCGWLNATPRADLFPLLLDTHDGAPELSAYPYNREWSTTPPLSAHPLPIIGLWAPERGVYAAWDFQLARLTDNSERDIATGFCNRLIVPVAPEPPASDPDHLIPGHPQPPQDILPPIDAATLGDQAGKPRPELPFEAQSRLEYDRTGAGKFVALVYPHGGTGYQQCVYPQIGAHIASRATLDYSLDLHATDDPNRFLWQTWWADDAVRLRLPQVPAADDLSWIGTVGHLKTLPGAPGGGILAGVEGQFQVPGTRLINGWSWHNESAVAAPAKRGDKARIAELEREAATLVRYAKRFTVEKEPCVYWEKPLVGQWTAAWGGAPVTTLHNANGWAAGRLLLDLYRYDGKKSYLPLIEGVYNWTKHVVWTRNEFADVPSSPFAIGGTLATAFLLDYYFTFKNDADRRTRAIEALDLAQSFTYRTMVMWTADSRHDDALDSAFLWEPNSGRDWTGAACANEVIWNLDTLAQTAVHTGDPILLWALQGSLSRWHLLYQDAYHDALADYRPDDFTEGYGLAPGNVYGEPGKRAAYGFGGPLAMLDPVGDTTVRVLAGEKAALAFDREGTHTTLADYRCTGDGDFAFTVRSTRPSVDITVTFPGVDLTDRPVYLRRQLIMKIPLKAGDRVLRDPNALWSLIVKDVHAGDTVMVGDPDMASADQLPCAPPLIQTVQTATGDLQTNSIAPFIPVPFPLTVTLSADWRQNEYAGLFGGLRHSYDIPFLLTAPQVRGANGDLRLKVPVAGAQELYLLYTPALPGASRAAAPSAQNTGPTLQVQGNEAQRDESTKDHLENTLPTPVLDDGARLKPDGASRALAWRAWPPVQTQRLLAESYKIPAGRTIVGIDTAGTTIVAATALPRSPAAAEKAAQIEAGLAAGRHEYTVLLAAEQRMTALREVSAQLPTGKIALLPPVRADAPTSEALSRGGFSKRMLALTPEQMVDPAQFNAQRTPIALYIGGEEFTGTIHAPGDVGAALQRYVHEGGTLVLMSGQPYPLFYGADAKGARIADPLLPHLGLPLTNAIETAPTDVLTIEPLEAHKILGGNHAAYKYPEGDPRLRAVDRTALPPGATYTPLYHVRGAFGKDYGDAAALLQLPAVQGHPAGRILYFSNVLLRDPVYGPRLIDAVLRWLVTSP